MTLDDGLNLVPELRFSEFRDSREWRTKPLGNLGGFLSALTGKRAKDFEKGNAVFIPYTNVFMNTFTDVSDLRTVNLSQNESQNSVIKGDVFFTVSSENPEEAGMSSVLLEDIENCYLNSFCALFRFKKRSHPNLIFLGYLLRSPMIRTHLSRGAQGATRYNISKRTLRNLPLFVPSRGEQKKIADCLMSLDHLISAESRKLESLTKLRNGLLQQLFPQFHDNRIQNVPKLRFDEFAGESAWEYVPLKKIARRITLRNTLAAGLKVLTNSAERGLVEQRDYFDKDIATNTRNYFVVEKGDFVYNPRVSASAPVGPISRNLIGKGVISPLYTAFRIKSTTSDFHAHYFKSSHWHEYVRRWSNSGARHDRMAIKNDDVMNLPIPLPSPNEQRKIAECLSSLEDILSAQEERLTNLEQHKHGLLCQLFPVTKS